MRLVSLVLLKETLKMRLDWQSAVIDPMTSLDAVETSPVGKVNFFVCLFPMFPLVFALGSGGLIGLSRRFC